MSRNLLAQETSPYLLQHQDNPVHWRPWNAETLAEARQSGRPILLSIGYAACHWCHVMAHESFEDEATAALMNDLFIPIKVDREERPDLDAIYQAALAMMGQRGGWPLTMFLTPAAEPFWGGTYFPPKPRYGMPSFRDVLTSVAEVWKTQPDKVAGNVNALKEGLQDQSRSSPGDGLSASLLERAANAVLGQVDLTHGGLSGAPKFPHMPLFTLLWRVGCKTGQPGLAHAVSLTLNRMSQGGIYDHLGGGFARYSTDEEWLAPHFEKMLYDNAQLIELLTEVHQTSKDPLFAQRVEETIGWVLREMRGEGGAFAATLDADSEGEEGRFYVWHAHEIEDHLPKSMLLPFVGNYDVTPGGNWEGKTILNLSNAIPMSPTMQELMAEARQKLFKVREGRVRPGRDDKILADWNGMTIAALGRAGFVFNRPDWVMTAEEAFDAVVDQMEQDGRLSHSYCLGKAKDQAMLDDYAQMARAAVILFEVTGNHDLLAKAEGWVSVADRFYWDLDHGGYFFTASDAEDLLVRTKTALDNATPSGNGVMVEVLARLFLLTGKQDYQTRAEAVVRAFAGDAATSFPNMASLLNGWEILDQGRSLTLTGEIGPDLLDAARQSPPTMVIKREAGSGKPFSLLCQGHSCSLPLYDGPSLVTALKGEL